MGDGVNGFRGRVDFGGLMGPLWVTGWLFTLGYLHLVLPKALFAIILWPYYLGAALAH
jgi:hypothetical protein